MPAKAISNTPSPVGARLAGEGDLKYAFAGKPGSYRYCVLQLRMFLPGPGPAFYNTKCGNHSDSAGM